MTLPSRARAARAYLAPVLLGAAALAAIAVGCSPDADLFSDPGSVGGAGGAGGEGGDPFPSGSSSSSASSSATSTSSTSATSSSSSGGSVCGDGACAPDEDAQSCPADCGFTCVHPLCQTGDPLTLGCDACVDTICAQDPFCCDNFWDESCVGQADSVCGAGCCGDGQCNETCQACPQDCGACPAGPTCPHSVCLAAEALDPAVCFDPCVSQVCAAMPSCCMGNPPAWDAACTQQAQMLCGPDPCITAVCQSMPTCCTDAWTDACVALAVTTCMTGCDCAHGICSGGDALAASCNPCVAAVCAVDAYCCQSGWDGICTGEVEAICGIDCG